MGKNRERTGQVTYNFQGLSETLLGASESLLYAWVPGGKKRGSEYVAGSLSGGPGDSFSCNLTSGKWADFATGEKGGDLISLYAAIHGADNGTAYKELSEEMNFERHIPKAARRAEPAKPDTSVALIPPQDIAPPQMKHALYGEPSAVYDYRDEEGRLLHFVARYEPKPGEKQFLPYSYADGKWRTKAYPAPRPLFGLPLLKENPNRHVLLVEGEKACLAARKLVNGHYVVLTWSGGAMAYTKANLEPLRGRSVLIWPDCDEPGIKAGNALARELTKICGEVKILEVDDMPKDGFDAADFQGLWGEFRTWGRERVRVVKKIEPDVLPPKPPAEEPGRDEPQVTDEQADAISELELFRNHAGIPHASEINLVKILTGMSEFQNKIWYDNFYGKTFTSLSGKVHEWTDRDTLALLLFFQQNFPMPSLSVDKVDRAVTCFAGNNRRNEPKDWMESLTWDGIDRLPKFMLQYFGAEHNYYTEAVSLNFWVSMIARIYQPGCKVDNMAVLISSQGTRKSTAIEAIAGKWYASITESPASKDFYVALQGKMLIELEELKTMKNQDAELVKAMLSKATDRLRMPYGRHAEDFPRQNIFIGTTNREEFLTDDTGNRRFWPIRTGEFRIDELKRDRDQLFAEAVVRYKAGATWWEVPSDAESIQEDHRREDEWQEAIEEWLIGKTETTVRSVASDLLKIDLCDLDMFRQKRIARILTRIGYQKTRAKRGGKTVINWVKKW